MKIKGIVLNTLVLTLVLIGATHVSMSKETKADRAKGPIVEGFQLSAQLEKERVGRGEPINLKVFLKNTTDSDLFFADAGYRRDFTLTVTYGNGRPVQLTDEGRKLNESRGSIFGRSGVKLRPGQVLEYNLVVNTLYVMTAPGTYTITVNRNVPRKRARGLSKINSNKVVLTVT